MSDSYQTIADVDATEDEAEALAAGLVPWLAAAGVVAVPAPLGTRRDGIEIITGRTVFDPLAADRVACPGCRAEADWEWVSEAIGDWHAGGDGRSACPACGRSLALNDWDWDPAWAFGCLGLRFWNWPPLRPSFVAEIASRLGHRVVMVTGRL